ncbi:BgTH12-05464 [Blumeria graminis f. sp. triticale]|uniref:BgTH12-05459 n=1 Tax=Blumeria graminis f. sp. triticale TaxID=1689686 RepID=A0A9W4D1F9_BLUGR|nr:BgTH12-05459 [Blumeria graminis f. sp. triticale]CAD6502875.1 BgTH12-05464 [Blumeria graminis f. sp. triticale]
MKIPEELPLFNEKVKKFAPPSRKNAPLKPTKIEKFDGSNADFKTWSTAMDLRFVKYPEDFSTLELRLTEIAEHCSGRAANWMNAIIIGNCEDLIDDYAEFIAQFIRTFQDAQYISRMQDQYMTRHVKGSVAIFATQFEEASNALGYLPNVMALQFLHQMQPEIRKALNCQPTLDRKDYEMVRKLGVEVDSNIYLERKGERTARSRTYCYELTCGLNYEAVKLQRSSQFRRGNGSKVAD